MVAGGAGGAGASPPRVVVASEVGLTIRAMPDVMDVIGAAYDADALILTADDVDAALFRPSHGVGGRAVPEGGPGRGPVGPGAPGPVLHGPRWPELAFEHRRHRAIRIVASRAEADAWLAT